MMTCAEAARLMSDHMNRSLGRRKRMALRLHLIMCTGCRHYRGQLDLMRLWLRSGRAEGLQEPAQLDVKARARIQAALVEKH